MQTQTENSFLQTERESAGTSSLKAQLIHSLATGLEYRHAFVEEKVRTGIAVQTKAIREQREMTQTEFAKKLDKSQSWVSRLEDPNKAIPTIPTLLLLAKAFDVDLDVRFEPFSQMLHRVSRLTPEGFRVPSFTEEYEANAFVAETSANAQQNMGRPNRTIEAVAGASVYQPLASCGSLRQKSA